jgi:hypothetical protein
LLSLICSAVHSLVSTILPSSIYVAFTLFKAARAHRDGLDVTCVVQSTDDCQANVHAQDNDQINIAQAFISVVFI